jgi:aminopeptidase N
MKKLVVCLLSVISGYVLMAQPGAKQTDTSWKKNYREAATKINDLVHTRLNARFDFNKAYMYGQAWTTH